ncbi:MAG: serine-threonine protein phosphatase [Labilithrix sp.]|nr:serine-threonine protein phosphatase [Labilithrix sp.]
MRRTSFVLGFPTLRAVLSVALATVTAGSAGCDRSRSPEPAPAPAALPEAGPAARTASSGVAPDALPPPLAPAVPGDPARVVAIGDLHGDLEATRRALRLAGAIGASDAWTGGPLVVVQTGDLVDRGDDDRKILDLVESLKKQARAAGGAFVALSGNHEIMNAMFDFRYVTPASFTAFADVAPKPADQVKLAAVERAMWGRAAAFMPGSGSYAAMIADRPLMARVGDSLFVHGGILPKHQAYGLARINDETREWLSGTRPAVPPPVAADDGPLWTRLYSNGSAPDDSPGCRTLATVLTQEKAKRLVMGHTVQQRGINAMCNDRAWRIDVGMAKFFGGPTEVLEIKGDAVRVLKGS